MKTKKTALTKEQKKAIMNRRPSRSIQEIYEAKAINSDGTIKHQRLLNVINWIPKHEKPSSYPWLDLPKSQSIETRKPLFWGKISGDEYWFVNDSEEILHYVGIRNSVDEETQTSTSSFRYYYENVKPREAVLVDVIHPMLDSDYLLQLKIELESKLFGKLLLHTGVEKGYIPETVFVWKTDEFEHSLNLISN